MSIHEITSDSMIPVNQHSASPMIPLDENEEDEDDGPPTLEPEGLSSMEPAEEDEDDNTQITGITRNSSFDDLSQDQEPPDVVCCGLCGLILPYDQLISDHLPNFHAEILAGTGTVELEEIPYEEWVNEKPGDHKISPIVHYHKGRKTTNYRINGDMNIKQLETALNLKMIERLGREVPVSLVDKLHAQCGLCNAIVSLNRRFEIIHLIRHFNAWHPAEHACAGTWPPLTTAGSVEQKKPLSVKHFTIANETTQQKPVSNNKPNIQCNLCPCFMARKTMAMHYNDCHSESIDVPKCNLCVQELIINATFTAIYKENFGITITSEGHYRTTTFGKRIFKSEEFLAKEIEQKQAKNNDRLDDKSIIDTSTDTQVQDKDGLEPSNSAQNEVGSTFSISNSHMKLGRHGRAKREFISPVLRQAIPKDSQYIEPISLSHWRCKLCQADIFGVVISAEAIKHFNTNHPEEADALKFDIMIARLERLSNGQLNYLCDDDDGNQRLKCTLCQLKFSLHAPFNMGRAIRHLKVRHPTVLPEYQYSNKSTEDGSDNSVPSTSESTATLRRKRPRAIDRDEAFDYSHTYHEAEDQDKKEADDGIIYAAELSDEPTLESLRKAYNSDFDKAYSIYGTSIATQIYVLCEKGSDLDEKSVEGIVDEASNYPSDSDPFVVQYSRNWAQ